MVLLCEFEIWTFSLGTGSKFKKKVIPDTYARTNSMVFFRRIQIPLEVLSKTRFAANNMYSRQYRVIARYPKAPLCFPLPVIPPSAFGYPYQNGHMWSLMRTVDSPNASKIPFESFCWVNLKANASCRRPQIYSK